MYPYCADQSHLADEPREREGGCACGDRAGRLLAEQEEATAIEGAIGTYRVVVVTW